MITPLDNSIKNVMEITWPMIVICILTISSIRITYLLKAKEKFILYKEIFYLLFLMYILILFQIVTLEDTTTYVNNNNLIPFKEILRYKLGSRLFFKNVIGNIVLFIPYGIFASLYTKIDKIFHALGLVLFASATVEITQLLIGRVFDIDDIILNVIGGLIGFGIYYLVNKLGESVPKIFRTTWFLNILSIILTLLLICYVWMVVI